VIYLDGNSLGALPRATAARVRDGRRARVGRGLIRSWNGAGWIDAPRRVGAKIARLIGAQRRGHLRRLHLAQPVQGAGLRAAHAAQRGGWRSGG
jgi:hypothetical protein